MAARADVFVMLDDVPSVRNGWSRRNRIVLPSSEDPKWITVPLKGAKLDMMIGDVQIDPNPVARRKLIETIRYAYLRTPWFDNYFEEIRQTIEDNWSNLYDLDVALLRLLLRYLDLPDNLVRSSECAIPGKSDDKVVGLCRYLNASVYIANNGSVDYIEPKKFVEHNIGFVFQNYEHPTYPQGDHDFVSHLSVLDILFRLGPAAQEIILSGEPANWRDNIVRT